jgi:hypothetical protein
MFFYYAIFCLLFIIYLSPVDQAIALEYLPVVFKLAEWTALFLCGYFGFRQGSNPATHLYRMNECKPLKV